MPTTPWTALDLVRGLFALPHVWDPTLGEHLAAFKILCLQKTTELGGWIPCPSCDCYHSIVIRNGHPGAIAECRCEPPNCPDFPLTIEQATNWEVNQPRLGRAIARALGCPAKLNTFPLLNTLQFASWSADSVPVILTIQHDKSMFRRVIAELGLRLARPYILFAPTNADMDARSQELLALAKASFFTLDATVRLTEQGTLQALKTPGELFSQFMPDPGHSAAETVARQTIALAKALDSEHKFRKAPLYTVFILYCSECLSATQIAKRCRCARTLIFDRLKLLTKKLGRRPSELRQYSAHLDRFRDSIADSRARSTPTPP